MLKSYKFHEYLNTKKEIKSPEVKKVADKVDVPANRAEKPPKEGYAKGGQEYSTGTKKTKKGGYDHGFADIKDVGWEGSVYKPNIGDDEGTVNSAGKESAKIPTAEHIKMANNIVQNMMDHPELIEHVVRQAKQQGVLGPLVAEIFEEKESAKHLAEIMSHQTYGPKLCRGLTKAINETVAVPFAKEEQGIKDEEEESPDATDDEGAEDLDVGFEDNEANTDPSMMGNTMPAPQDMNAMSVGGQQVGPINPMMGNPAQPNPIMAGAPEMQQMPPTQPNMPMMMKAFQRAMMRAYQRAMMRKQ